MKTHVCRYQWYFIAVAAVSLLAGSALYADFRAGYYTPMGPETIHRLLPNIASTDATYDAGQYPIYYPELAPGEGKNDVENNCELCHSPRYITMQPPLTAATWAGEVDKMRKTYGANIPEDAAQKIAQYLGSHYSPETRKQ